MTIAIVQQPVEMECFGSVECTKIAYSRIYPYFTKLRQLDIRMQLVNLQEVCTMNTLRFNLLDSQFFRALYRLLCSSMLQSFCCSVVVIASMALRFIRHLFWCQTFSNIEKKRNFLSRKLRGSRGLELIQMPIQFIS